MFEVPALFIHSCLGYNEMVIYLKKLLPITNPSIQTFPDLTISYSILDDAFGFPQNLSLGNSMNSVQLFKLISLNDDIDIDVNKIKKQLYDYISSKDSTMRLTNNYLIPMNEYHYGLCYYNFMNNEQSNEDIVSHYSQMKNDDFMFCEELLNALEKN